MLLLRPFRPRPFLKPRHRNEAAELGMLEIAHPEGAFEVADIGDDPVAARGWGITPVHRTHDTFSRGDPVLPRCDDRAETSGRDIAAIPRVGTLIRVEHIGDLVGRGVEAVKVAHRA